MGANIYLMFGIHSHQPVGNFDSVFKRAYEQCYKPFLKMLSEHAAVRSALHFSGCLLEWIEQHEPAYIDLIARLAERGQVELLSGGFYEPILPAIPREDAIGQIRMMNDYIFRRFGQKARGLWLAERVWEPHLPSLIAEAGLEYTLVDDTHFIYAGLQPGKLFGYYLTEDNGARLAVFPIDKNLRYYIPFKLPQDTIDYLKGISAEGAPKGVTYGDDAEKFGVWPETYKWVYTEKYLERMFKGIEKNSDWIKMPTFSEYIDAHPPTGRIYLPTASYDEMTEWALPPDAGANYLDIIEKFKKEGTYASYRPFLRGGFWRNYLAKYPEANRMHKKMLEVSKKVRSFKGEKLEEARRELWRGQCNCPYWHGLFGGLYLNYLRHANYRHLLEAERLADNSAEMRLERLDYDCDGFEELLVSGPIYSAYITPGYGGSIAEIDYRPKAFNITDVMSRRRETYHRKLAEAAMGTAEGQVKSIHDLVRVKEKGLEGLLHYDRYDRRAFQDHFLHPRTVIADMASSSYKEEGDFIDQPYSLVEDKVEHGKVAVTLKRDGKLARPDGPIPLFLEKKYTISGPAGIEAQYHIQCGDKAAGQTIFAAELNLTLLAGDAEDRFYEIPLRQLQDKRMNSMGSERKVSTVRLVDQWMRIAIRLDFEPAAEFWRFPIQTVSQSESGFERTYQGSCVLAIWPLELDAGVSVRRSITLKLEAP